MCQGILECEGLVGTKSAEGIMASGHANRIKRPNTWLHRPMLQNVKKALANPEPSTHLKHANCIERRPLSGATWTTCAHAEFF